MGREFGQGVGVGIIADIGDWFRDCIGILYPNGRLPGFDERQLVIVFTIEIGLQLYFVVTGSGELGVAELAFDRRIQCLLAPSLSRRVNF